MAEDHFQEIEERVEQEAREIRCRRKAIEEEALRTSIFTAFKVEITNVVRAELTAKRLVNASVSASQQSNVIEAIAALRVAIEIDDTCWEAYYN